jgi:urea carboxylase
MLKQADAQLSGRGGLEASYLDGLQPSSPKGSAIECRIYAENPAREYAPSPGTLQQVKWNHTADSRIETWVHTGTKIPSYYDPLVAKVMCHAPTREEVIKKIHEMLSSSRNYGRPINLDFLANFLINPDFKAGKALTKFLSDFKYVPVAIPVLAGGAYTLIEDWPGRPIWQRFSHSGPMDPLAFRIANSLVGDPVGMEGLENTSSGPDLRFLGSAVVALCGAPMDAKLDGQAFPMWTRTQIEAGQRLKIGRTTGGGCRSYLAVRGWFPNIAEWFGSKARAPMTGLGGYQGRALTSGDLLDLVDDLSKVKES